jgi:transposase
MEVLHPRCAGLDVHKDTVVACVRIVEGNRVESKLRTFGTMTRDLDELAAWLAEHDCTHAAMEATGVYWKPVWHVLEEEVELILANAADIKNRPGRKTDACDAQWIAELLAHGLISPSFVPPPAVQEMRNLTRTRKQLVREVVQHKLRIQKTLEDANIKLASVISDILGQGGRAILMAMIDGVEDPKRLASYAPHVHAPTSKLIEALNGRVHDHHRFLLKLHIDQIDALEAGIGKIERELQRVDDSFREARRRLTTIPGFSDTVAAVVISEIGIDMSRFPTAGNLLSWACMCPRNDESAGKRRSTRVRPGCVWLKTTMVQAGWAAIRVKDSYARAQYLRIRSRRGPKKAIIAVAASLLTAAYHMLRNKTDYKERGGGYFDNLSKAKTAQRLLKRLAALGYEATIQPAA